MLRRDVIRRLAMATCCVGNISSFDVRAQGDRAPVSAVASVAAASDLKFALEEIVDQLEKNSPHRFRLTLGSSGSLAQQIRQGLPAELYLSADEDYVFRLADAGLTQDRGALYALGRIAIYVPLNSPLSLDTKLEGLRNNWTKVSQFAIANPDHAPYGRAARQALQKLGLWELVKPKLVLGENISQATQFVTTGAAQAGITALSLGLAPQVASLGRHLALPDHLHAPLRQRMVLLKTAGPAAAALYAYLQSAPARVVLARYGFSIG